MTSIVLTFLNSWLWPVAVLLCLVFLLRTLRPNFAVGAAVSILAIALCVGASSFVRTNLLHLLDITTGGISSQLIGLNKSTSYADVRFKFILELEVDGAPRKFESVHELKVRKSGSDGIGGVPRAYDDYFGEAIYADLGPSRPGLLMLLSTEVVTGGHGSGPGEDRFENLMPEACGIAHRFDTIDDYILALNSLTGTCSVPAIMLPVVLSVPNAADPFSYQLADFRNLGAAFGNNVVFRSLEIEFTDEPVTTGLDKSLPWLQSKDIQREFYIPKLVNRQSVSNRYSLVESSFLKGHNYESWSGFD
ncbi:MAG: hypothetical protein KDJ19_14635 [Hyphomicrobiaceae bacterium]|nr:hypothetical protein [Hyphomicrobiaceae bacterium]MCC0024391.1 hypothetical protein [Hyphomicrobiaceae bacterium]